MAPLAPLPEPNEEGWDPLWEIGDIWDQRIDAYYENIVVPEEKRQAQQHLNQVTSTVNSNPLPASEPQLNSNANQSEEAATVSVNHETPQKTTTSFKLPMRLRSRPEEEVRSEKKRQLAAASVSQETQKKRRKAHDTETTKQDNLLILSDQQNSAALLSPIPGPEQKSKPSPSHPPVVSRPVRVRVRAPTPNPSPCTPNSSDSDDEPPIRRRRVRNKSILASNTTCKPRSRSASLPPSSAQRGSRTPDSTSTATRRTLHVQPTKRSGQTLARLSKSTPKTSSQRSRRLGKQKCSASRRPEKSRRTRFNSSQMRKDDTRRTKSRLNDIWRGDDRTDTFIQSAPAVHSRHDEKVQWTLRESRCFAIRYSSIHRFGLFATVPIPAGAMVIEYIGERVDHDRSELRDVMYTLKGTDMYIYQLHKGTTDVLDATNRSGPAKYVNHCCEPNVWAEEIVEYVERDSGEMEKLNRDRTKMEKVNRGRDEMEQVNRIWFRSFRAIEKGEEIMVDYGMKREVGERREPCNCKRPTCHGALNYA